MLRATIVALTTTLVCGGSALSSNAFARDLGHGGDVAGSDFRFDLSAAAFGRGRTISKGYRGHGAHVSGLRGGFNVRDVWGHWGAYYGPMVPTI